MAELVNQMLDLFGVGAFMLLAALIYLLWRLPDGKE